MGNCAVFENTIPHTKRWFFSDTAQK